MSLKLHCSLFLGKTLIKPWIIGPGGGGGGGGVLPRILDRGVPRRFVNPNPI